MRSLFDRIYRARCRERQRAGCQDTKRALKPCCSSHNSISTRCHWSTPYTLPLILLESPELGKPACLGHCLYCYCSLYFRGSIPEPTPIRLQADVDDPWCYCCCRDCWQDSFLSGSRESDAST